MWSPDISTAPPRASGLRASRSTTRVTISPKNTCRSSTSCGKAAGKMGQCCATARNACSRGRRRCTASDTTASIFQIEAIHLCEPSPQRTPLIYQAGASSRGRQFAATHAECVFINGPSKQVIAPIVADIRRRAAATGRNPAEILIFTMMTVITAATSDAARAKLEDYRSYVSEEGALVLMSGWTGLDFSKYGPDEPILHSRQDAQTSALEAFTIGDPDRVWTVREIAKHAAIGGRGPVVVGSPEEVAEELIAWVEDTDVDGFNLAYAVMPETFADFVDLVVPELQRRG